jgi:hypothetical protein
LKPANAHASRVPPNARGGGGVSTLPGLLETSARIISQLLGMKFIEKVKNATQIMKERVFESNLWCSEWKNRKIPT